MRLRRFALLIACFTVAACAPAAVENSAQTPAPTPAAEPGNPEVTLAFAGDVHFTARTLGVLADVGKLDPVAKMMADADVAMVNLETAVTTRGTAERKTFLFRSPPGAFAALKSAGIDVVTVANNHALDYGRVGLADTLADAATARMPVVGAGSSAASAFDHHLFSIRGTRIAVLGMSQVSELWQQWRATDDDSGIAMARDTTRAVNAVRQAAKAADVVVVYLHWGTEYQKCPSKEQRTLARQLADAGADVIVGTHAHVLQGDGWLDDAYVHYGMSNFVWWRNDAATNDTEVLRITVRSGRVASADVVPAYINRTTGVPYAVGGSAASRILGVRSRATACSGLTPPTAP
ncbi:CapA family protein [Hamadaea sp. NPDC051192]|uniref:CapA family protein n=1 Tax=Hamadaea sp. NPDC051192 TaxID=3154940 RepID=UPI00341C6FE4